MRHVCFALAFVLAYALDSRFLCSALLSSLKEVLHLHPFSPCSYDRSLDYKMNVAEFYKFQECILEKNCSICQESQVRAQEEWFNAMHYLCGYVKKETLKPVKATIRKTELGITMGITLSAPPWMSLCHPFPLQTLLRLLALLQMKCHFLAPPQMSLLFLAWLPLPP